MELAYPHLLKVTRVISRKSRSTAQFYQRGGGSHGDAPLLAAFSGRAPVPGVLQVYLSCQAVSYYITVEPRRDKGTETRDTDLADWAKRK